MLWRGNGYFLRSAIIVEVLYGSTQDPLSSISIMGYFENQTVLEKYKNISEHFYVCILKISFNLLNSSLCQNEPRHEKTCFYHMRTTKAQISLRIRAVLSALLLFAVYIV